jgi:hypothetical protein
MLKTIWRWIRGPKATPEQRKAAEEAWAELDHRREKAVGQYYEDGFPSREAQKGTFPL